MKAQCLCGLGNKTVVSTQKISSQCKSLEPVVAGLSPTSLDAVSQQCRKTTWGAAQWCKGTGTVIISWSQPEGINEILSGSFPMGPHYSPITVPLTLTYFWTDSWEERGKEGVMGGGGNRAAGQHTRCWGSVSSLLDGLWWHVLYPMCSAPSLGSVYSLVQHSDRGTLQNSREESSVSGRLWFEINFQIFHSKSQNFGRGETDVDKYHTLIYKVVSVIPSL